jgi:hypothetical protein
LEGITPLFWSKNGQFLVDFLANWQNMVINGFCGAVAGPLVALSRNMLYFAKFAPFWHVFGFGYSFIYQNTKRP